MSNIAKLSLPPTTLETSEGRTKEVLEAGKKSAGSIPNMYAGMANSPALLDNYLHGYQLFRTESGFTPAEQELVFLSIARVNECTYCVAAHSFIAGAVSKTPAQAVQAIRDDASIEDARLAALSKFTQTMVSSRGKPTPEELAAFLSLGYTEKNVLEIILAIAVKTISNYSNHVLHTPVDAMFKAQSWAPKA
ncbi:carboxymuconolactone decarboxylase family protein [Undibacterium sp. Jales W-56]|uniref:carboxymuconolactone decarboxylase family protein n=1 Tax=Undibacterium sp. Jales W-56 TaxID=2897325 RepID=UPI0021D03C00|nr:carboxymuconolactone decarboxylase family protein [Undibacterium sp. Jales W-56]MCU6435177.1 carboxymuconolactone decarboxylase family protein [Undibacterium sp. Jales W-56]